MSAMSMMTNSSPVPTLNMDPTLVVGRAPVRSPPDLLGGGEAPGRQLDAGRHQKVDDAGLSRLHDGHGAVRATEVVRTGVVLDAHAHPDVGGGEFHVPAVRARGSNRCHA